ncbi:MAG TPA: NAD-binding protein [Thermoleophilaceae bacterium]|nr:NAD-binding protein [Thermoleophilaceae bacterium]
MAGAGGSRVEAYFGSLVERYEQPEPPSLVCIVHLLPTALDFVPALARVGRVASVLPKPKSIDEGVGNELKAKFQIDLLTRDRLADAAQASALLEARAGGQHVVLLDIGGYFAPSLAALCAGFSGQILGVVEDTENGLQKYERAGDLPCPVYSVARSPLKNAEDYLVGVAIVFSTEAVLRTRGDVLQGRSAAVIGYGKIGRSIAAQLHARHVSTTIYDTDPIAATEAVSHGFRVARDAAAAVEGAGLVISATGNRGIGGEEFPRLATGAYVASVTSSDDELGLDERGPYEYRWESQDVARYSADGHYFYVLNEGNAVNFLHGATLGPAIYLVQGEVLAGIAALCAGDSAGGMQEVAADERREIARVWLEHFNDDSG